MKKISLALIILIIVGICIPAVSAAVITESELPFYDEQWVQTYGTYKTAYSSDGQYKSANYEGKLYLRLDHVENFKNLHYTRWTYNGDVLTEGENPFKYKNPADSVIKDGFYICNKYRNLLGSVVKTDVVFFYPGWSVGTRTGLYNEPLRDSTGSYLLRTYGDWLHSFGSKVSGDDAFKGGHYVDRWSIGKRVWESTVESYTNNRYGLAVEPATDLPIDRFKFVYVNLTRIFDGDASQSNLLIYDREDNVVGSSYTAVDVSYLVDISELYKINVNNAFHNNTYIFNLPGDPGEPGEPGDTILRTGSVTMTDHNGTSITGFEVTAVNYYTGEEYTVSTDTDVAVITLPMDRTVEIQNPQTGAYEEAPVGYYIFYGQKPGYKMLHEDGIRVRVMPEKYGSYKLCNILVTSDTGPLTGKHKFQLRSWSDNSILQTGTISAKSRTTGIWYNTTVTNGIATLILPYDTSDALSEHAGHYYVYATSPGYEDNNYGVQIIVTPQTVSEVKTILLTPIGGVPTPGNVTLRIQAISETGQGVPNAEIFIAGKLGAGKDLWDTYTTSWTGFLEVSVPGNSTYDIVARGAGYYDSSRRIEVFTEDPPIIEMRLYLSGAPTVEPTTEPTGWPTGTPIGPTPTMTAPTGEPVSNWLEWFAAHFGMILGGGAEIGKIFMWLCFAVPVGVYVGKESKAGAAGFMAGAGIVTLFFVLIGWVPIWLLVLLALIIGLLYAKVFNTPDNGGGR